MDDSLYTSLLQEVEAGRQQARSRQLSEVATEEALRESLPSQQPEVIPGTGAPPARAEAPAVPFEPVDWSTFRRPPTQPDTESVLDSPSLSRGFVDDVRIAMLRSSNKDVNPFALGDTPREVFNKAISSGLLKADFKPSEDMGALTPYWDQYQLQMKGGTEGPSVLAAIGRGAVAAIGPTLGGIAGAMAGSTTSPVTGPVGPIVGGLAGSMVGGEAQEALFPATPEEKAQLMFDYGLPETRWGRMLGQFLPSFLTMKPGLSNKLNTAINAGIAGGIDIGMIANEMFAGKEVDKEVLRDRIIFDLATAVLTKPNKVGSYLFDRNRRLEVEALQRRNAIAEAAAGGRAGAEQAQVNIAANMPLETPDVILGFGNMSGNSGLIALQAALERRNGRLMDQRIAAKAGTAKGLSEATALVGETAAHAGKFAQMKFEGQNADLFATAAQVRQDLINKGNLEGAAILTNAEAIIKNTFRQVEAGRINAETANARALLALSDAQTKLASFGGSATKESASRNAKIKFTANEILSNQIVKNAYEEVKTKGTPAFGTFSNLYKSAEELKRDLAVREINLNKGLPEVAKDILTQYAPDKNGKFSQYDFTDLQNELADINSKLREFQEGTTEYRQFSILRAGIEQDLEKAAQKNQLLKQANAIYKAHKEKYYKGKSHNASLGDESKFLDTFLNESVEEQNRLRSALTDPETGVLSSEAVLEIQQWILNQLTNSFGSQPKAKTLQEWRRKNEATRTLESVFPEASPGVDKFIQDIADAEAQVVEMTSRLKRAEENQAEVIRENDRFRAAAEQRKAARITLGEKEGKETFAETQAKINDSAATRFIGPEPKTAVRNIMEDRSRDPRQQMAELWRRASQDTTGQTLESLRNAVRQYIKKETALLAQVVSGENAANKEIVQKDVAASLRALNEQLNPEDSFRQVLNIVLPQKEIEALKLVRNQIEILNRRTALTQGESSTAFNSAQDIVLQEGLKDNLVSIFGQVAKGIDPTRRAGISRALLNLYDATKRIWKGNVARRTEELMEDAMKDPHVAIEMLRPIKDINVERSRGFLRLWTITKDRNLEFEPVPFSALTTNSEDLANGTVTTDTANGYKIIRTPQKNFRLLSPEGDAMGVYRSYDEAVSKSISDKQNRLLQR